MALSRFARTAALVAFLAVPLVPTVSAQENGARAAAPKSSDSRLIDRAHVLKRPPFPSEARNGGVAGTVAVRVTVSPEGEVISARAVSGPEALRQAAVKAAQSWEFNDASSPDSETGFLVFKFSLGDRYAAIVGAPAQVVADADSDRDATQPVAALTPPAASQPAAPQPAAQQSPAKPAPASPPSMLRVPGGVLIARATRKVSPRYPQAAASARIEGAVIVEVTVDERGSVVDAKAVSGHAMLRDAAVQAARQWAFAPTVVSGTAVKVTGSLTFNFKQSS